jgi:hypothetical protein
MVIPIPTPLIVIPILNPSIVIPSKARNLLPPNAIPILDPDCHSEQSEESAFANSEQLANTKRCVPHGTSPDRFLFYVMRVTKKASCPPL